MALDLVQWFGRPRGRVVAEFHTELLQFLDRLLSF